MPQEAEVRLTKGCTAIIDLADLKKIQKIRWYAHEDKSGLVYARNKPIGMMHRFIMNVSAGIIIDHKDGNGLNNRRTNLRIATHTQNSRNRTLRKNRMFCPYKGVERTDKKTMKWTVRVTVKKGVRQCFGRFATALEAALAYDDVAVKVFKEFAFLNFPERYNIKQRKK